MSGDEVCPQCEADVLRREVERLRRELTYAAEAVGAQTFGVLRIGKGRHERLVSIVDRMLASADGAITLAHGRFGRSTAEVRNRFPEWLDPHGHKDAS